ncbi:amidophosphoribosyltransferase [Alkaliphilus peptidifermentans]|uniref:Amidophosphoribosyltransferase n=1 Tax=Alkaliphilus peptidifermentans DSM 18978 TaxID=1120976 RepID=A0A1G5I8S4_9FIRM|nr:amidophosphoribosyltransferase [Alkaliphilus peptidifermentans]SCY72453.1 amidophosphoribosyltransferase [Alkaliphilus peptidifermentans DSM 18978]
MLDRIDFDKLKEECGVVGVYRNNHDARVDKLVYYGLFALQHRGQESAGIATNDGDFAHFHKGMGLVSEVFNDTIFEKLRGHIGIGHVRYSTTGESYIANAQPLVVKYRRGSIGLAHNGNLTNAALLRERLEDDGVVFQTTIDSEVIVNLIARYSNEGLAYAIERTMDLIKGAYALVVMTEKELIGVRDPYGLRPLCVGKLDDGYVIASESCALDVIGAKFVKDVEPGEMVIINEKGMSFKQIEKEVKKSSCIFEYIYFARPDSVIDGVSVYQARKNAGIILANEHPVDADMVIAVPDTSIPAAIGYADTLGIPFGEGFIKNRYIGRTFIQPDQTMREMAVLIKLNPMRQTVEGKRIVMIDDSIVRGTTSGQIVNSLKRAGAKEVHVRISSPPVAHSCYYGIDTPDRNQLIGAIKTVDEIREIIGADSLGYISLKGLKDSVGIDDDPFCHACFCGTYPIEVPEASCKKTFKRLGGEK